MGLGLQLEPGAVQHLPDTLRVLITSGLLPAAVIAIVLNLVLLRELAGESTEEVSGGRRLQCAAAKWDDQPGSPAARRKAC